MARAVPWLTDEQFVALIAHTHRLGDRLILLAMRTHDLSPRGDGAFGHRRIADLTALSPNYVRNRLAALRKMGHVVSVRRGPHPSAHQLSAKAKESTPQVETKESTVQVTTRKESIAQVESLMSPPGVATGTKESTPEGSGDRSTNYTPPPTPPSRRRNKKTATPDELAVLEHYQTVHPKRKVLRDGLPVSERLITIVRTALGWGFSPAELIEAIDGNLQDPWHYEKRKHELAYILRTSEKVDDFRDRYDWGQQLSDLVRTPTA